MKFRWGPPPTDLAFQAELTNWHKMWKPNLSTLLVGVIVVFGIVFYLFFDRVQSDWPLWITMALFLGILLLHELIHALLFPDRGLSNDTTFGCWLKMGVCYAHYQGIFNYRQFVLALLGPLVLLSGFLLILNMLFDQWWLRWIALFNFGISLGDVFFVVCFAFQAPRNGMVRTNGFDIYWKEENK